MPQQGLVLIRMAAHVLARPALAACKQPAPMPAAAPNACALVGAQCACTGLAAPSYGAIR